MNQDREQQLVEFRNRTCKRCGRKFVARKGERRPNGECQVCQPSLPFAELEQAGRAELDG